jgi:hypothetical protein
MAVQVKGAVLLSRKALVCTEYGDDAWDKVIEAVSEESRQQLKGLVLSASWYPFKLNEELDRAIVDVVGGGDLNIFKKIGVKSAQENLKGPHKAFLTPGEPMRFLEQSDCIYRFYYDVGYREFEATGPNSGVITTYEAETFSEADCLTVIGWYEEALQMCGATKVVMTEEACRARGDAHCRYRVSFEM